MKKFTEYGYITTKSRQYGNAVEVEGVEYWISAQDMLRIAQALGKKTQGLKACEYGIDGQRVKVVVRRGERRDWAELAANQATYCPVVF